MRRNLSGRKLLITGAARGIGEKVARLAAARGARVALIGLEPDRLRALADELGAGASWWEADVRDGAALRSAIHRCAKTMGGIDIAVANAGVAAYGTVRQADEESFERVLAINLNGVFRTLKYATPHLESSRGHAMVVASAIAFTPLAGLASYAASKAGVEMLALAYRQEVAHLGITVGLVHPSWINTDSARLERGGGHRPAQPHHPGMGRLLPGRGVVQAVRQPGSLSVQAHLQVGQTQPREQADVLDR